LKDNPGRRPGDQLKQKDENSMDNGPLSTPKYTSKGQVSDPIARIQDHPAFPFVSSDDFFVAELRALPAYCLALRINLRNLGGYRPFPVECQPSPPCLENEDEAVQEEEEEEEEKNEGYASMYVKGGMTVVSRSEYEWRRDNERLFPNCVIPESRDLNTDAYNAKLKQTMTNLEIPSVFNRDYEGREKVKKDAVQDSVLMPFSWHLRKVHGDVIGSRQRQALVLRGGLFVKLVQGLVCNPDKSAQHVDMNRARRVVNRSHSHFLALKAETAEQLFQEGQRLHDDKRFCEAATKWGQAALLRHPSSHALLAGILLDGRGGVFKMVDDNNYGQAHNFDRKKSASVFDCAYHLAYLGDGLGCVHSRGLLALCFLRRHRYYGIPTYRHNKKKKDGTNWFCPCNHGRAIALAMESADAGSCFGQYAVALHFRKKNNFFEECHHGDRTDDFIRFLRLAAANGHAHAEYKLAWNCFHGHKELLKNQTEAIPLLHNAAAKGYVKPLRILGELYENGSGVPQDYSKAAMYFLACRAYDSVYVNWRLARMFELGLGVVQDSAEAIRLYELAITEKSRGQIHEALSRLYRVAAYQGDAGAQYKLGKLIDEDVARHQPHGFREITKKGKVIAKTVPCGNQSEAVRYIRLAADQGHKDAQYYLGDILRSGRKEVDRDGLEALRYYRLAADQGHLRALEKMAFLFEDGCEGVEKDFNEAFRLFRLVAEKAEALQDMEGDEGIHMKNLKIEAQESLGCYYEKCMGVEHNREEAIRWYRLAGTSRSNEGLARLGHASTEDAVTEKIFTVTRSPAAP
jgi:TPR repeat protein